MSKISELAYDIEQLYIEGYNAASIAVQLGCPIGVVEGWIEGNGCEDSQDLSPFETINS